MVGLTSRCRCSASLLPAGKLMGWIRHFFYWTVFAFMVVAKVVVMVLDLGLLLELLDIAFPEKVALEMTGL